MSKNVPGRIEESLQNVQTDRRIVDREEANLVFTAVITYSLVNFVADKLP
jgi:hypothetical protein